MDPKLPTKKQKMTGMIRLRSSDGVLFDVDHEVAMQFLSLEPMISQGRVNGVVDISDVTGDILGKAIEYSAQHVKAKDPNRLHIWETEFVKLDQSTLFDLMKAAYTLRIAGLMDLACRAVAKMIKGMSVEEVRETFQIVNDFTPEEEALIREDARRVTDA